MSKSNENNRPMVSVALPVIAAPIVLPIMLAGKKLRIRSAKLVQEAVIAASGTNFLTYQLKIDNVLKGVAIDTQAGVAVRTALPLDLGTLGFLDLEKDEYLSLDVTEDGTFTDGDLAILSLDIEVIGN